MTPASTIKAAGIIFGQYEGPLVRNTRLKTKRATSVNSQINVEIAYEYTMATARLLCAASVRWLNQLPRPIGKATAQTMSRRCSKGRRCAGGNQAKGR